MNMIIIIIKVKRKTKRKLLHHDLRNMLILVISFVYEPPYIVETVPVVMSSGSTVHSSSIGSEVFALEHCSGPCFLPDKENVLRYKGEFFRRATNQFEATETAAYRETCIILERNMPVDDYTYSSLYMHEIHETQLEDPSFVPKGTRFYRRHDDVRKFTQLFTTSNPEIPVVDVLFVCDLLVPISCAYGEHTTGHREDETQHLSTNTEAKAYQYRRKLWWTKRFLYKNFRIQEFKSPDHNTCRNIFHQEDAGC